MTSTIWRIGFAAVYFLLASAHSPSAHADTMLWGGHPEFGIEFEQEQSASTHQRNNSITLTPSLVFANRGVDRIDLLITGEQEAGENNTTANATTLGLRVKKSMELHNEWSMYVRAFVGQSFKSDDHHFFGYTDAALTYEQDAIGFMVGVRVQRNLNGGDSHNVNKIRIGPSFELGQHHELEFRWERAWHSRSLDRESDSANIEYTYKF